MIFVLCPSAIFSATFTRFPYPFSGDLPIETAFACSERLFQAL